MRRTLQPIWLCYLLLLGGGTAGTAEVPGRFAGEGIVVGLEYALTDNENATAAKAAVFAETGMTGMKNVGESVGWGVMQKSPDAAIVFDRVDWFVREYQRNGFTDLTLPLKPHCTWGSKKSGRFLTRNSSPKPEHMGRFERWVESVVERYDADGHSDMPGLRWPIRVIEIGIEFSSYQPEPVEDYLEMLAVAYRAAHRANPAILVAHSAFLTTPVDLAVSAPSHYAEVWRSTPRRDEHHGLADIQAILDRPDVFDVVNLHNLGSPYEIEHQMRWLAWELGRRGYSKPVILSDTLPTSYVAWGPATTCEGTKLGILIPPATEADRCRLAQYFTKLVDGDPETLAWTRGFVAADHVQRTIIAAEQGIERINLSFVIDLPFLTSRLARAGAGISAWAGAVRQNPHTGHVHERYPLFYAIRQLMGHLAGYRSIARVDMGDPRARVYRLEAPQGPLWVAWRDPMAVLLPEDGEPRLAVELDLGMARARIEQVITEPGVSSPQVRTSPTESGRLRLSLSHTPVFVASAP